MGKVLSVLGTVYVYPLRSCPNQSPTTDCVRWRRLLPYRQLLPVGNGMERTLFLHTIQRQRQSDSEGVRVTVTVSEIERERESWTEAATEKYEIGRIWVYTVI